MPRNNGSPDVTSLADHREARTDLQVTAPSGPAAAGRGWRGSVSTTSGERIRLAVTTTSRRPCAASSARSGGGHRGDCRGENKRMDCSRPRLDKTTLKFSVAIEVDGGDRTYKHARWSFSAGKTAIRIRSLLEDHAPGGHAAGRRRRRENRWWAGCAARPEPADARREEFNRRCATGEWAKRNHPRRQAFHARCRAGGGILDQTTSPWRCTSRCAIPRHRPPACSRPAASRAAPAVGSSSAISGRL